MGSYRLLQTTTVSRDKYLNDDFMQEMNLPPPEWRTIISWSCVHPFENDAD